MDMSCNPGGTFQEPCQMQQKNHLDISCNFCPHSRECQRKILLEKKMRTMLSYLKYIDFFWPNSGDPGPGSQKAD